MRRRFGHDFSAVRVHDDAEAANSARAVDALAYTIGRDIVFGAGQYAPHSTAGRRILAHELVHVLQQSGGLASPEPAAGPAHSVGPSGLSLQRFGDPTKIPPGLPCDVATST